MAKIKDVQAVYTGGNIWLFYGALTDGTFFLVDDYGAVRITRKPWDNLYESLQIEWQEDKENFVKDITDEQERTAFCRMMLRKLRQESTEQQGGFYEYESYMKYFSEPL